MQESETKELKEHEENILSLSTMTFSQILDGSNLSLKPSDLGMLRELVGLASQELVTEVTGTYLNSNGFTISFFVKDGIICLATLPKPESGLWERLAKAALTKVRSNIWKLATWLIALMFLMNLVGSMSRM